MDKFLIKFQNKLTCFLPSRQIFEESVPKSQSAPEKPKAPDTLADINQGIAIREPMQAMLKIEKDLKTGNKNGETREYILAGEKALATYQNGKVSWQTSHGETIEPKALWLQKILDSTNEISKAENEDISRLRSWDKSKLAELFLVKSPDPNIFQVNLKGKTKFEKNLGAGDLLGDDKQRIEVTDKNGNIRTGTRETRNGRTGYYDPDYIPIYTGYTIKILPNPSPGGTISNSTDTGSATASSPTNPDNPVTNNESLKGPSRLLIFGDSLMVGAQGGLKKDATEKNHTMVGKSLRKMTEEFEAMDKSGQLTNFRNESMVINGGINDLAGGDSAEKIISNYQKIIDIAKKHGMHLNICTILPFGLARTYQSLMGNFQAREASRNSINSTLAQMASQNSDLVKLIPLHNRVSDGGLADDNDPSKLAPAYASGDGLHLSGGGYTKMASLINASVGDLTTKSAPPTAAALENKTLSDFSKGSPIQYTADYGKLATRINNQFINEKAQPGATKLVYHNGQYLIATHAIHDTQASTGNKGTFLATELSHAVPKKSLNA